jgi:anti-anti-sigma regulatory factor
MLKITRVQNGGLIFRLSGRMDAENIGELETLLRSEYTDHPLVLDLKDLTLVDQEVVSFLIRCESDGIELKNCPVYIREWINGEPR